MFLDTGLKTQDIHHLRLVFFWGKLELCPLGLDLCFSVRNSPEVGAVREEIDREKSGQMDYTLTWRGGARA